MTTSTNVQSGDYLTVAYNYDIETTSEVEVTPGGTYQGITYSTEPFWRNQQVQGGTPVLNNEWLRRVFVTAPTPQPGRIYWTPQWRTIWEDCDPLPAEPPIHPFHEVPEGL